MKNHPENRQPRPSANQHPDPSSNHRREAGFNNHTNEMNTPGDTMAGIIEPRSNSLKKASESASGNDPQHGQQMVENGRDNGNQNRAENYANPVPSPAPEITKELNRIATP